MSHVLMGTMLRQIWDKEMNWTASTASLKASPASPIWWGSMVVWWQCQTRTKWFCLPRILWCLPYGMLTPKFERNGFKGWTNLWIRNYMDECSQRVVVNDSMFMWRLVTSRVPHGSVLGLLLINVSPLISSSMIQTVGLCAPTATL